LTTVGSLVSYSFILYNNVMETSITESVVITKTSEKCEEKVSDIIKCCLSCGTWFGICLKSSFANNN